MHAEQHGTTRHLLRCKRLHPADALSTHCNMDAVRMGWKCAMASWTQSVSARYGFSRAVFRCNKKSRKDNFFVHMINAFLKVQDKNNPLAFVLIPEVI